jgi:flagellar basal body-associated protein FliL
MFREERAAKQNPNAAGETTGGTAMALLWVLIVLVIVFAIVGGEASSST